MHFYNYMVWAALRKHCGFIVKVASLASATPSVAYARFARSLTWV